MTKLEINSYQHIGKGTFYREELRAVTDGIKGPVESFAVTNDYEVRTQALETGVITPGAFANCTVFGVDDEALLQKSKRYELSRGLGIYDMLEQRDVDTRSLEDVLLRLGIQQEVLRSVVVEASRKHNREAADGTLTERSRDFYGRVLEQAQADLYPSVDPAIVEYSSSLVMQKIATSNPHLKSQIVEKYPFMDAAPRKSNELLGQQKREQWHHHLHDTYDPVFAGVRSDMGEEISNEVLPVAVTKFMEKIGLPMTQDPADDSRWMVEAQMDETSKVSGFRVDPERLRVICGKRSKEITWAIFEQLMMHEIIVHTTRAQHGYETGYKALQIGVPGNQEPEEGLGILMEKLWTGGSLDTVGRDHYRYLAVCYADGNLDGVQHTETETFDFVTDIMASAQPTDDFVGRKATVSKAAYDHVKRPFRGMPPGHIMKSNLAYLSGKLKMAQFLDQTEGEPAELLAYLQTGKFNPLDAEQATIPNQLQEI